MDKYIFLDIILFAFSFFIVLTAPINSKYYLFQSIENQLQGAFTAGVFWILGAIMMIYEAGMIIDYLNQVKRKKYPLKYGS